MGVIIIVWDLKFEINLVIDLYVIVFDGFIVVIEKLRVQFIGKYQYLICKLLFKYKKREFGFMFLINFDCIFIFLDFNNVFMFINLFVIISQNEDIVFGMVLYILMLFDVDVGVMLLYIMIVNLFVYVGLFMFVINSEFIISGFCVFVCLFNFFKLYFFKFQKFEFF